jgi:energy-converting hydrogenase Eha subunit H
MKYIEMLFPLIGLACVLIVTCSIALISYTKYLETKRIEWQNKELIIQECKAMGMRK